MVRMLTAFDCVPNDGDTQVMRMEGLTLSMPINTSSIRYNQIYALNEFENDRDVYVYIIK
jgi:hypothetical protein